MFEIEKVNTMNSIENQPRKGKKKKKKERMPADKCSVND
jgi:hypothetical protein